MANIKKSDDNEDGIVEKENEYKFLSQKLRLAESDRARYIEEMHQSIFKLKTHIDELEAEKADLVLGMDIVDSKGNHLKDEKTCEDLANFGDNKEWVQEQTAEERALQAELDGQIREIEKKLGNLHNAVGGSNFSQSASNTSLIRKKTLNSKLSHALKKYNDILGSNKTMREDIDVLRMERARYDVMFKKLDQVLTKLRTDINNTVESASASYGQREEAHTKMMQITERCQKDMAQHNLEMKELVRIIDHDRKLKKFMNSKALVRKEDSQLAAWKAKQAKENDEKALAVLSSFHSYERTFNEMVKLSGQDSIDQLVNVFVKKEDRNYALFSYVAERNAHVEGLIKEVSKIKTEISKLERNALNSDLSYKENNRNWERKRNDLGHMIEHNENDLQAAYACIGEIIESVRSIFDMIKCDSSILYKKLGPKGPQSHNILTYIIAIENRINELLLLRSSIDNYETGNTSDANTVLIGAQLMAPMVNPRVIVPVISDELEGDATNAEKPYSRSELHRRIIEIVHKKEPPLKESLAH